MRTAFSAQLRPAIKRSAQKVHSVEATGRPFSASPALTHGWTELTEFGASIRSRNKRTVCAADREGVPCVRADPVAEVSLAKVRRDRHTLRVLLQRGVHHLLDRPVVTEVDHLAALALEDPTHDVDRGVMPVEQSRGGDETDRVPGLVEFDPEIPSR